MYNDYQVFEADLGKQEVAEELPELSDFCDCGGELVYFEGTNPTGVEGEFWSEEGYVCRRCKTRQSV